MTGGASDEREHSGTDPKITESEELQTKFSALSSPEEAYELAKEIQDGFTKEEFLESAKALPASMNEDISDEDLASAAGGLDEPVGDKDRELTVNIPPITDKSVSRLTRTIPPYSGVIKSKASKTLAV